MANTAHLRTMFGIKLSRLRDARRLTLSALAGQAGVSVSYLAEIEAGKKFPRAEKLLGLADALGLSLEDLISSKVDAEFAPLQGFLDSPGLANFPFERFGLPREELVHLLSRSPNEVAALLRTLNDIARQYDIGVEHFLHAALRSYQELTGNYYPDLEAAAEAFADELAEAFPDCTQGEQLERWVAAELGLSIDDRALGNAAPLKTVRAVRFEGERRLLISPALTASQRAYILAREAAYHRLRLKARSWVSPPDSDGSFDQVINDFRASYFAGAVLLPRRVISAELKKWFRQTKWQPSVLLDLMDRYQVTAETLMYRMSQITPGEFGLKVHFLKFRTEGTTYRLVKQLNLSNLPVPEGHGGSEHYCRRWLTTRLLTELNQRQHRHPRRQPDPAIGVQSSRFHDRTDEYFCLGLAAPAALDPTINTSLTIGFKMDEAFFRTVRFAKDRSIQRALISSTCERCPFDSTTCRDRVAPPSRVRRERAHQAQQRALTALRSTP
ncbi:MAG: helix-turn-helix domain-containing protein [Gemmatimonadales bacterium]|nr:helix-turn-helix domain-containing protein [Gemmatimonadales bacterium]